jgi:uncharacterized SAM-binding protein YcdF (DUF218 family)
MTNLTGIVKDDATRSRQLPLSTSPGQKALGGVFVRRYRWGLSSKAKFFLLLLVLGLIATIFLGIYRFLAITEPVKSDVLVVEGWVHSYAIRASVEEFKTHSYRYIFTTGGPVVGKGGYVNDYQTSASVGADLLKEAGMPADLIQMVPSRVIGRDRTYSSAIALRDWLRVHDLRLQSFNVVTEGAHARRTRLLFEKAFGPGVRIGVIAVDSPDYDAKHWWYYSEGVEAVLTEGVAYLYVRFFFLPSQRN